MRRRKDLQLKMPSGQENHSNLPVGPGQQPQQCKLTKNGPRDLGSEAVKRVLAEHLAEGAEVGSVTRHLLTAMQTEAKRRRTTG